MKTHKELPERREMERREMEEKERNQKLCQWLMALTEASGEDGEAIQAYLEGHSLPQLLWEYPTLGIPIHVERRLEAIAQLVSYDGRDVSWKQTVTAGPG